MRMRDFPIRRNLALLILFASGSAVVIASAGFAIHEGQRYRAGALREATALADTLGANTAAAVGFGDQRTAQGMLSALAADPNVLGANLYDSRGLLFATYRSHGAAAGLIAPVYRGDGATFGRENLRLSRGVFLNRERTGSIEIVFSLSEFQTMLIEYSEIATLVFLLSVLSAWLASMRLARVISDPLTQIPNRLYLIDRLESAIETADQSNSLFAVLFVHLDQFKLVNDSLGHSAGDELLIDAARRLRTSIRAVSRQGDSGPSVVARIGGDEFAILLPHIQKQEEAAIIAGRLLERLREPFYFEDHRLFISASIGIALYAAGNGPEDLLRNADTAMYAAKTSGKSHYEFFNENMLERAVARFTIETGLHKAIDLDQLVLHYQPIVAVDDGCVHGFEALVRWNHPERGLLYPSEFVSVAEESELIIELGEWVLREACRQMAEWQKTLTLERPLVVGVNVSFRQLNPHLVDEVQAALAKSGIDPEQLALEMTESSIMVNAEQALATLECLKAMNVKLEIDDFGTGYSSLSYLQRLPFDTLKIDRSFIRELGSRESGSLDIVKAILELARSLNLEVIAEGIETEEQTRRLTELGCDSLQGFFLSKPVGAELARLWLERDSVLGVNAPVHYLTAPWDSPSTLSPIRPGIKLLSPNVSLRRLPLRNG